MDRLLRRALLLLSSPVIVWIFLKKSWVQLALLLIVYANAERWLSVRPFSLIEFVDFFADHTDALVGIVGLVVAFAAAKGFIESKQLDLKLALEAEVGELMQAGAKSIHTCRRAAESMVEVEELARSLVLQASANNTSPVIFPTRVEGAYHTLLRRARDLPEAQGSFESHLARFLEMERKWAPLIRSSLITSLALEKAKSALEAVKSASTLLEPRQNWPIEEFLVRQEGHWGTRADEFVSLARVNENRFYFWMGAASGMGAGSIFPPSVLITTRLWWRLY
ncbi:hypothetical protein B9Y60_14565 [Stenotrophomonas maltophilia]|uniref:hypothetical protein n=1 Tax=Stenotrophomonas maltophilia TaxID=40324 RepID=UPI000C26400F|nr:hypothetical protein [Stenotrophomonas maltophilia]PJL51007.1 hypothetical protein B9Y73_14565 [Stenotrophomonas maltophilia]PJL54583.1 hypothetical protein B9Y60_14565 [Stenotrophomonas maltophilia]